MKLMNYNKNEVMGAFNASMTPDLSIDFSGLGDAGNGGISWDGSAKVGDSFAGDIMHADYQMTGWNYWQNYYYPYVIKESYPVYIQERAQDKGKQAFEIIKMLKDKKIIKLEKVEDFVNAMDELIKIL